MTEEKKATGKAVATQAQDNGTPPALLDRGITLPQWRVLTESVWPSAESKEAVFMAIDYCKARGLDPFKKPVHIVPVWSSKHKKMVETVWPGISELRTTAARTGEYIGKETPIFGPDKTEMIGNVEITYPEWCEVRVWRQVGGHKAMFSAIVYWKEAYAQKGGKNHDRTPNAMWLKRPRGQLAKCTEAEALREAFPEEIGGLHASEEMEGQVIEGNTGSGKDAFDLSGRPSRSENIDAMAGSEAAQDDDGEIRGDDRPEEEATQEASEDDDAIDVESEPADEPSENKPASSGKPARYLKDRARFEISDEGLVTDNETGKQVPDKFVKIFDDGGFSILKGYYDQPADEEPEPEEDDTGELALELYDFFGAAMDPPAASAEEWVTRYIKALGLCQKVEQVQNLAAANEDTLVLLNEIDVDQWQMATQSAVSRREMLKAQSDERAAAERAQKRAAQEKDEDNGQGGLAI